MSAKGGHRVFRLFPLQFASSGRKLSGIAGRFFGCDVIFEDLLVVEGEVDLIDIA